MSTQDAEYFKLKEVVIDYTHQPASRDDVKVRLILDPMDKPDEA